MLDPEAFGAAMGDLIREAVEPLQRQIGELQAQIKAAPDFESLVAAEVERRIAAIPVPRDGKDADMVQIEATLSTALKSFEEAGAAAIQALPVPKDGLNGSSVTIDDVQPILEVAIEQMSKSAALQLNAAISAIQTPKDGEPGMDGKSVTLEDVTGMLETAVAKWALEFERRGQDTIQRALDKLVQPKDGEPGKDGRDGLGFDDLQVEYDGEKTITLKMEKGDVVKEANIVMPIVIDKGIYKEGQTYLPGDGVTWGGSYWICKSESAAKPDSADSGWRLAVKRGRDGKDGLNGIDKTAPVKL